MYTPYPTNLSISFSFSISLIHIFVSFAFVAMVAQVTIKFGKLFEETANIFDALVGIIKTAKKFVDIHPPPTHTCACTNTHI